MKIAVWKTGHEIADTVADALKYNADIWPTDSTKSNTFGTLLHNYDAHIGYGILRGTADIFRECDRQGLLWFNVDRGYFSPNHFDGYYRISYRGTQAIYDRDRLFPPALNRFDLAEKLEPFNTGGSCVLICPPTAAVCDFFGIDLQRWKDAAIFECAANGFQFAWREKGDSIPINWDDVIAVITFNSSVGWEAVRRGIPCLSSVEHSTVGSFYGEKSLDSLMGIFHDRSREQLFSMMRGHQFTLSEIRAGAAWGLIRHYLSTSVMIAGRPSPLTSPPTPSENAPIHS